MPDAISNSNVVTQQSPQALTPQRQQPDEDPVNQLRPEQRVEEPQESQQQQANQSDPEERLGTQVDTQA